MHADRLRNRLAVRHRAAEAVHAVGHEHRRRIGIVLQAIGNERIRRDLSHIQIPLFLYFLQKAACRYGHTSAFLHYTIYTQKLQPLSPPSAREKYLRFGRNSPPAVRTQRGGTFFTQSRPARKAASCAEYPQAVHNFCA